MAEALMPTIVELISATDTIAFHPTPDVTGWVYDNETLNAWYALPSADAKLSKRPNAHGAYSPGQIFTDEHRPVVSGQYYGASTTAALVARNRLNALFSDGLPVTMRVTDELGATTRQVWLLEAATTFRYDFSHFPLDLSLVAPDPRRYGGTLRTSAGMPSAGSGLVWNLGTAVSGLYFDWGTAGVLGQVQYMNDGNATTLPRIEVGGAGGFDVGFRVTEIETGRELTFVRATSTGDIIVLDSRTQRATISNGGGDVTAALSSRDWFEIPAGATRRYQITPLGAVTGAPTITLYVAPAYM